MTSNLPRFLSRHRAFSLVEILISMVILSMILIVVVSIADQTRRTWQFTTSKIQEFSAARTAFDTIARKLSQATLNTYWDYVDGSGNGKTTANASTFTPVAYARQSELKFASGLTADLAPSPVSPRPLHGVFFQAPLGLSESTASTGSLVGLDNLLNSCGFYVEFGDDSAFIPSFLSAAGKVKPRYRFRLMEATQPSNALSVYSAANWLDAFKPSGNTPSHVLAENVIALIVLPKRSAQDTSGSAALAPNYTYNSTMGNADSITKNQLPPVVQLTMVALDEPSANKLATLNGHNMPTDLFSSQQFSISDQFLNDLHALEATLISKRLNYRVFTTNVTIRAAKWGGK